MTNKKSVSAGLLWKKCGRLFVLKYIMKIIHYFERMLSVFCLF